MKKESEGAANAPNSPANEERLTRLLKGFGIGPTLDLCRVESKNGALFLYIPCTLRDKLALNGERSLVGICEGNSLVLVKDSQLVALLRPLVLKMRQAAAELRARTLAVSV